MSDTTAHQFLLMGLPGTGKTSFLAALWYMVNQSDIACALQLDRLEGESKYLNQIRDAWLGYKPVPRNPLDSDKSVSMFLKRRDSGAQVELSIPDLSGESFKLQWAKREITRAYDRRLREASGAILFVHPESIAKPHRIDVAIRLAGTVPDNAKAPHKTGDTVSEVVSKKWDIEKAPTQVQLVDLLQIVMSREYFRPHFRIAIVVSAWDLVSRHSSTAEDWLSEELPLLHEFLECNKSAFDVRCYGISAQGGRYALSLLSEDNFKNGKAFAKSLSEGGDPLSAWLWTQLDASTQARLVRAELTQEEAQFILANSLNQVMAKQSIYNDDLFRNVSLRSETKELLKSPSTKIGEDAIRLNRLLLEDAYPSDLTKNRQFEKESLDLQKKKPGRRVFLQGPEISNPHDITEPIQWLMR